MPVSGLLAVWRRFRKALRQLPYLRRAMALVWESSRGWTLAWGGLLVVGGMLPVALVFLTRALVDGIAALAGAGGGLTAARPILLVVAAVAVVMLLSEIVRAAGNLVRETQAEIVEDHVRDLIHRQATAVDLAFYDSPEFHDHLHRAQREAGHRPVALLEGLGSVLQSAVTLLAMAGVLAAYGLWLTAALVVSTVPALVAVLAATVREHEWHRTHTEEHRRAWYFDWLLTSRETAAEVRLFDLGDRFRGAHRAARRGLRGKRLLLRRRESAALLAAGLWGLGVSAAAAALMIVRTVNGLYSLGDLALLYQAFNLGQRLLRAMLEQAGRVYGNVLFLGDLFEYLQLRPSIVDPATPAALPDAPTAAIQLRDVAFAYPGADAPVFDGLDLDLPAGKTVALVGPNGAGKSTLLKLLCRLYDPQRGRVLLDGTDLREFEQADLRRRITALFQSPVEYSATAFDNIAIASSAADEVRVDAAVRAAGAEEIVARLPAGLETLLGKWFSGGADLSGGEWQRIALARAFLRNAPILLLDEPTSAMDSWAEVAWMQRLRDLSAGKTVLLITHRFTTAMQADVINVMRAGRIVESGSHPELLTQDGFYAASWRAQVEMLEADRERRERSALPTAGG